MARENKQDPNAEAVAEEDRVLREKLAGASAATPQAPNSYTDRVEPLLNEVAAQMTKDRGKPHSRA